MQKALLGILVAAAMFLGPVRRSFDSWKSYGGGVDSSQYSSLKQIDKTNVKQLQVAWTFPVGGNTSTSALVVDGVTGRICDDPAELPAAIAEASQLDPAACRAHVEANFGAGTLGRGYEQVYHQLLRSRRHARRCLDQ